MKYAIGNNTKLKLEIVGWKGKASVRAYVPKNDRIHYLRLIGGDTSKYEKNKFEVKRENNVIVDDAAILDSNNSTTI